MKYINFKRYKFVTFIKNINFKRYNFYKLHKYFNIQRYNFYRLHKYFNIQRYNFYRLHKHFNIQRFSFYNANKYLNFKKINFNKFYKYFDYRKYDLEKIIKIVYFKKFKHIYFYLSGFIVFAIIIYLSVPMFYKYDQLSYQIKLCNELNIKCVINDKIKYSFIPSPRIKIKNVTLKDFTKEDKNIGQIESVDIKLSIFNLLNKKNFNIESIQLDNVQINLNLNNFNYYKNFFKKKLILKSIYLKRGTINFFDNEKGLSSIHEIDLKYKYKKKSNNLTLNGLFLNKPILIELQSSPEENKKKLTIKLPKIKAILKADIFNKFSDKNDLYGNLLYKQGKVRFASEYNFQKNKLILKSGNIRNSFLDGKISGDINFFPFFTFDLNCDLNGMNFTKFHSFFVTLDTKNLFKINKKINGQLSLSNKKLYSKYNFIKSFESRLKFINGDIIIDQFLINMGKIGAADIAGTIENNKKFTNLKFENNIFIDNPKSFYNKFGIYNKETNPQNIFIEGILNLVNLNMRIREISFGEKLKEDDVIYVEKEFNDILLEDGYISLFNFPNFKEFVKLVTSEDN